MLFTEAKEKNVKAKYIELDAKAIGNGISRLSKKEGFSQTELSKRMGVTTACVNKWFTGRSIPTAEHLIVLANLFGLTIDDLIYVKIKRSKSKK